jgi:hypothetical protein
VFFWPRANQSRQPLVQTFQSSFFLESSNGFLHFSAGSPFLCFLPLSPIHHRTLLFFCPHGKHVQLVFSRLHFVYIYEPHTYNYYLPNFITNVLTFYPTSCPSLDVQFITSLKSKLCTALVTQNTKLHFSPLCFKFHTSLACNKRVNVGLLLTNLLSRSRPITWVNKIASFQVVISMKLHVRRHSS